MNLIGLLIFGLIFSIILLKSLFFKSSIIRYGLFTKVLSPLFFIGFLFVIISSFQYINTSELAQWSSDKYRNDLPRYKKIFDIAINYSLPQFVSQVRQEPLFLLYIYILRHVTSHFSVVLLLSYSFIFLAIVSFVKNFDIKPQFISILSFSSILYTLLLSYFCLFRLGIAWAIGLYVFRYIKAKKFFLSCLMAFIACGFHLSAAILLPICLMCYVFKCNFFSLGKFLLLFLLIIIVGFLLSNVIHHLIIDISDKYAIYKSGVLAINTYLTNLVFLLLILYKKKRFFKSDIDIICFVVLLSSFFVLDFQLVSSIMYRCLFFTYPFIMILIIRLYKIYKPIPKSIVIPLLVRGLCIVYPLYFLYKFCVDSWFSYGLNNYDLFFFY